MREDGTATATWTEGIAVALGREAAQAFERERHPLTAGERAWLEVLEAALPRVTARAPEVASLFGLEASAGASLEEEEELRRGVAMGKFDEKWGSLPVALWLHSEARVRGERETLETMIRLGPDGVLPLALRHAAPELRPRLEALAEAAATLRD